MAKLSRYLSSVLKRVQKKFPEAGLLIVSVEEDEAGEGATMTYLTNMEADEVAEIARPLVDPDNADPLECAPEEPAHDVTFH